MASSYDDFYRHAVAGVESLNKALKKLGIEEHDADGKYTDIFALSIDSLNKAIEVKNPHHNFDKTDPLKLTGDIQNFIASNKQHAAFIYSDYSIASGHPILCILARIPNTIDNTKIRLSLIDSIGNPIDNPPRINDYYSLLLQQLEPYLINHKNVEIEAGLLGVHSQYDKDTCKAWLAEFIRKTPDIFSLDDTLWENAADLESSVEKLYACKSAGNLKLYSLTQLPPKYMMAVQNPKVIRKYIESYQGSSPDIKKLETLLETRL
ncbi:hypothetical protein [uncultured Endozoicomonas sp.]|uniref:hypothetical protein n=1 Tax=uncultured Endozoicomonas sp. TaxID=432652 RepID=UPI00261A4607|nr:hypothetical protein [uncultured Endozoicomonas sp.]